MREKEQKVGKLEQLQDNYVLKTYANYPGVMFAKGKGVKLWDSDGRKYLDFASGISVCNLGHCHPSVTAAIRKQASKLVHVSNLYLNEKQPELAAKIVSNSFDGMVFFCNSGAEANEGQIKLARKRGNSCGRNKIIVMQESFHGRTLATLAATGRSKYREGFQPDMPGFIHVPFNDLQALAAAAADPAVCAVLLEPIQGEGGIVPAKEEYLNSVRQLCDDLDILLLFDEVQCGMGRTGRYFAWQNYGIEPDAFSLAKALGNGFPIGAFVVKRKHCSVLGPGTHASTFGGTPLACAAACAVFDAIESEDVLENCLKQSEYLFAGLRDIASSVGGIKEVRGKGLMIGLEMEVPAGELRKLAAEKGLLVLTAGENVLRLLPPLVIEKKHCDKALSILRVCLSNMRSGV